MRLQILRKTKKKQVDDKNNFVDEIDDNIYKLKIGERRINGTRGIFLSKKDEAEKRAEQAWNQGKTHQFKRHMRTYGQADKLLRFNEMLLAEIGGTRDVMELLKNIIIVGDLTKLLEKIHSKIGLDTNEISKAMDSLIKIKEQAIERVKEFEKFNGENMMDDTEFEELCKQKQTEFALKRETTDRKIKTEKNKLKKIKDFD